MLAEMSVPRDCNMSQPQNPIVGVCIFYSQEVLFIQLQHDFFHFRHLSFIHFIYHAFGTVVLAVHFISGAGSICEDSSRSSFILLVLCGDWCF